MIHRTFSALASAQFLIGCQIPSDFTPPTEETLIQSDVMRTQWNILQSEGLDALLLIGILADDELASPLYSAEVADFAQSLPPKTHAEIQAIGDALNGMDMLIGPSLVLIGSGAPNASLNDVVTSFADPDQYLRTAFEKSPYWDEAQWNLFRDHLAPGVHSVLVVFHESRFSQWRYDRYGDRLEHSLIEARAVFQPNAMIEWQSTLLGRKLDPNVDIILVALSRPYGIKILGQAFLNHFSYPAIIHYRTATHELLHPPFDNSDDEIWSWFSALESDPWMTSIVENADPKYGYRTFRSIVDEDSAQAMDQILNEKLGIARNPFDRWRQADGGMHVLAAGLYHAMKEDQVLERGISYREWLESAHARGVLQAAEIKSRAIKVIGRDAVEKWGMTTVIID